MSPYSYSLFNQSTQYIFGGSEFRAWLLGVGLSRLPENEVSFVVFNHGQPKVEHFGKVKVYSHSYYKSNLTFIEKFLRDLSGFCEGNERFNFNKINKFYISLLWRFPIILIYDILKIVKLLLHSDLYVDGYQISYKKISIYRNIAADIYCTFGVSNFSAEVAAFCKRFGKKFVLFSGSGDDFSTKYYKGSNEINVYGSIGQRCYYAISQAELIITQTQVQSRSLWEHFGKRSVTIYNPINLETSFNNDIDSENGKFALWIGKSDNIKRPEILLKLANSFLDVNFVMVLNRSDPDIHKRIIKHRPKNVRIVEYTSINEIEKFFMHAFVFINTSDFEGFPNTFLQAGKYGVPILSLKVDPDGFINKNNCGFVADGNFNNLIKGFSLLVTNKEETNMFSGNIRKYVSRYHDLNDKVSQLNKILGALYGNND